MAIINVLVAVRREQSSRYYKGLSPYKDLRLNLVSAIEDVNEALQNRDKPTDVLVIDNALGNVYDLIADVRQMNERLIIILVDEEADFAMPGQADEISTQPFENNELARKVMRLMSDRRTETLRADSLPSVRSFAKQLLSAPGEGGKIQATVETCKAMNYDYVGYYKIEQTTPALVLTLKAQEGPNAIKAVAPKQAAPTDIMTAVVSAGGKSSLAGVTDTPTHPLVAKGRLGAVACIPVIFGGKRYGALVACRERPNSIESNELLMLELIASQLGAAIAKESLT
jgi:hypothetical protein